MTSIFETGERISPEGLESLEAYVMYLRNIAPQFLRHGAMKVLRRIANRSKPTEEQVDIFEQYSSNDFRVTEESIEDSLDFLGICRK